MDTTKTRKIRASRIQAGSRVIIDGRPVEVTDVESKAHYPGWPSRPYTTVTARFAVGSGYALATYDHSEWVEVAR